MFLIHSELYFAYILFGLTKYKKVCFLNFGFNLRYFLGVIKYLYDYFSKKYQTWLGCVKILQSSEILVKNWKEKQKKRYPWEWIPLVVIKLV